MGSDLLITLPAQPDSIAAIRAAVGERAEALGADRQAVGDLKTVVSEACTNVVLHAYPKDAPKRPIVIGLGRRGDDLQLSVCDEGAGLRPPHGNRPLGLRMGLLLVGAIASCFQLRSERDGGTELTLRLPLQSDSA